MLIKQVIATANTPNENNRIYPKEVLLKMIRDFKPCVGQIGMSRTKMTPSHIVENLEMDGNNLVATIRILNNEAGIALEKMLKTTVFRTSGHGSTVDNVIQKDYTLNTINAIKS